MESSEHNRLIFRNGAPFFYLVLSEYANQSHNTTSAKRGKISCTAPGISSCLLLLVLCLIGFDNAKNSSVEN